MSSRYYVRSDYCQSKANGVADALSRFFPWGDSFLRAPLHRVFVCKKHVLPLEFQFWKETPEEDFQPRIRAEILDGWEDVEGIIKGTLASIQLENLLPGNPREICSCHYQLEVHQLRFDPHCSWLAYMSHDLSGIAYVYQFKKYKLQFNPCYYWLADVGRVYRWVSQQDLYWRAPVTIRPTSLSACNMSWCRYQSMHLSLRRSLSPST